MDQPVEARRARGPRVVEVALLLLAPLLILWLDLDSMRASKGRRPWLERARARVARSLRP